jgi:hypothetical protein
VGQRGHVKCRGLYFFFMVKETKTMWVGPCHHGMAPPQVADGGTAFDMEGSCE